MKTEVNKLRAILRDIRNNTLVFRENLDGKLRIETLDDETLFPSFTESEIKEIIALLQSWVDHRNFTPKDDKLYNVAINPEDDSVKSIEVNLDYFNLERNGNTMFFIRKPKNTLAERWADIHGKEYRAKVFDRNPGAYEAQEIAKKRWSSLLLYEHGFECGLSYANFLQAEKEK